LEKVENTTAANSIDWINGSLQYDVGGRFSEFALGNGIKKNVNYDDADRMTNLNYELPIEKQAAKKIKSYVYGFDEVDNIESKTVDGNTPNSYTYDERNMLKNADEYGKFQKAPSALDHTSFYKADRDFDGNKALEINELGWDNDIRLDAASRSICIDLDTPHTINNIELVPKNANHRVAQDDISIYLPIDDLPENGWEIFNDWRIVKDTDTGRMKIIFNTSVVTTYIKINTTWDDRDVDNNSIETGVRPFANTPDALIRVWTFQDSRQEVYEYDSIGNRLSSTSDGNSSSYVYEKNANGKNTTLLQEDSTWTYEYDGNGNLISKTRNEDVSQALSAEDKLAANHWDYEYDLHDRLTKVKRDGTVVASYVYDASGMRIARNGADGTSTCYSYSPNGKLLYETIRNGTQNIYERSSVLIGSTIIGWTEKVNNVEKAYFAITDHLGSVTVITDKDGQAVWRSEYSPYGTINGAEGSIDFQGIFTGKEVDLETGLYYFNARWYDPETGRFITEDPARDGVNWYAYCGNNPLNRIDPTGLSDKAPGMPSDVENKGYGQGTEYKGYNYTEGDPESGEQYDEDVLNEVARLARIAEFKQNSKEFGIGFFITAKKAYINQIKTVILGGGYVGNQIGSSLGGIIIDPVGTIDSGKRYLGQVLRGDPRTWGGIAYSVVEIVVAGVTIGALTEASVITIEAPAASKGGKQLLLDAPKMADHHLFPQQFRDAFKKMGINIDDFTVSVPQNTTHLKGLHGKGFNELPGGWNKAWQQFFTDNPGATAKDAFQFGGSLMDKYGLNGLPVSPY
jgi:RHS repeat-associated protein